MYFRLAEQGDYLGRVKADSDLNIRSGTAKRFGGQVTLLDQPYLL